MAKSVSLGWQIVDWIETFLCHGPGDLRGDPVSLDAELAAFIVRAYQVDDVTGRRLVRRAFLSRAKGRAKSELAAMVACCELIGPARFDRFAEAGELSDWGYVFAGGEPVGRPVRDPFIRCLATEEGQSSNTFGGVVVMLEHVAEHHGDRFPTLDIGITRVFVAGGGEIRPSTAASASKDGGKETFAVADETHLFVAPELHAMHDTVTRNLAKRRLAEPWMLETSTMYQPGQGSVAEATHDYARKVAAGEAADRGLLFDHRDGPVPEPWGDDDQMLASLTAAYGEASEWMDLDRILSEIRDPKTSKASAARYFLNRPVAESDVWITPDLWWPLKTETADLPGYAADVALGFDGSEGGVQSNADTTALVGCEMESGRLFVVGLWRADDYGGRIPRDAVSETVGEAIDGRWNVTRFYLDSWGWQSELAEWTGQYGERTDIAEISMNNRLPLVARYVELFTTAVKEQTLSHDGDKDLAEHVFNARRRPVNANNPDKGFTLAKDRQMSPRKIDLATAAVLAFAARNDAIKDGWAFNEFLF